MKKKSFIPQTKVKNPEPKRKGADPFREKGKHERKILRMRGLC